MISRALAGRKQTDHIPLANPSGQLGIRQSSEKAGYWRRRERYAHQPDLVMLSASFPIAPEGPVLDSFKVMSRLANSHALVNAAFRPLPCRPLASSSRRASEQAAATSSRRASEQAASSRRASEQAGSCRPGPSEAWRRGRKSWCGSKRRSRGRRGAANQGRLAATGRCAGPHPDRPHPLHVLVCAHGTCPMRPMADRFHA